MLCICLRWDVRISYGGKKEKIKFGLGITKLKKKKKPDTLKLNSKEKMSIVNKFAPPPPHRILPGTSLSPAPRGTSVLSWRHRAWGTLQSILTVKHKSLWARLEYEQSMRSELDQSWQVTTQYTGAITMEVTMWSFLGFFCKIIPSLHKQIPALLVKHSRRDHPGWHTTVSAGNFWLT